MIGARKALGTAGAVLALWLIVLGIMLVGIRASAVVIGGAAVLFLALLEATSRLQELWRGRRPAARRHRLGSVWSATGAGVGSLAAVAVADAVFTPQLTRRYGAASILVPAFALTLLATARMMSNSFVPARASKIANAIASVAFCAVGALLFLGVPSRHDERFGGWLLATAIVSLDFLWAPAIRVLNRAWVRVKPVAKFLIGDWEDDVGFLGDGRGRRRATAPLTHDAQLQGYVSAETSPRQSETPR